MSTGNRRIVGSRLKCPTGVVTFDRLDGGLGGGWFREGIGKLTGIRLMCKAVLYTCSVKGFGFYALIYSDIFAVASRKLIFT